MILRVFFGSLPVKGERREDVPPRTITFEAGTIVDSAMTGTAIVKKEYLYRIHSC